MLKSEVSDFTSIQFLSVRTAVSQTAGKLSTSQWVHPGNEPLNGVVGDHKYKSGRHGIKNRVCLFRVMGMGLANVEEEIDFAYSIERLLIDW